MQLEKAAKIVEAIARDRREQLTLAIDLTPAEERVDPAGQDVFANEREMIDALVLASITTRRVAEMAEAEPARDVLGEPKTMEFIGTCSSCGSDKVHITTREVADVTRT